MVPGINSPAGFSTPRHSRGTGPRRSTRHPSTSQSRPCRSLTPPWQPAGATAAGTAYSAIPASQCTGGVWTLPATTPTPIVYVPCGVNINGSGTARQLTLITDGPIRVNGSNNQITPTLTTIGLLSSNSITINGSNNTINGTTNAAAALSVNGSQSRLSCGVTAATITLGGSNHTFTSTCPTPLQ